MGTLPAISFDEMEEWIYERYDTITANSTDAELQSIVHEWVMEATSCDDPFWFDIGDALDCAQRQRDGLRELEDCR